MIVSLSFTFAGVTGTISGEQEVCVNDVETYSYTEHDDAYTYQWTITGGSPTTSSASSVDVTWSSSGSVALLLKNGSTTIYDDNINVDVYTGGTASSNITSNCGSIAVDLTLSGHVGTFDTWEKDEGSGYVSMSTTANPLNGHSVTQTTTFRAKITNTGGCSPKYSSTVTVTINPQPNLYTLSISGSECTASSTTTLQLSGSEDTNPATTYQLQKHNGTTYVNDGDPVDGTGSALSWSRGDGQYQVVATKGTCPRDMTGNPDISLVNPNTAKGIVAITSGSPSGCGSSSVTLEAQSYSGSVVKWRYSEFNGSTWSTDADVPNSDGEIDINVNPSITTKYWSVIDNSTCGDLEADGQTITITPASDAGTISAANTTICQGTAAGLSIGTAYTGTILRWEKSLNGGSNWTTIAWTDTLATFTSGNAAMDYVLTTTDQTHFRVVVQNATCPTDASNAVGITVNPTPGTPLNVTPGQECGPGPVAVTISASPGANGDQVRWFTTSSSTTALSTSNSYSPSISVTTTYWVETFNTTTGCVGERVSVIATVNDPPAPPTTTDQWQCQDPVTLVASGAPVGGNYRWYTASSGGNPIELSDPPVPVVSATYSPGTVSDTTTFYVSIVDANGCESTTRTAVTAFTLPSTGGVLDCAELQALKDLYLSTLGDSWSDTTGWPAASNWPIFEDAAEMATWNGITVSNGDITQLVLDGNNLIGPIPGSIGNLSALTHLKLHNNSLSDSIPDEIGDLTSLQHLHLYGNLLEGDIPNEITNLVNLTQLYLYFNDLTGTVPTNIGNMQALQLLLIHYNDLGGAVPTGLATLANLKQLYLGNNQFTEIPALDSLSGLTHLHLAGIATQNFPTWINSLTNLQYLNLNGTGLTALPEELSGVTKLTRLYLGNNEITGEIPDWIRDNTSLMDLHLYDNDLEGEIPIWISELTDLDYLYLDRNNLIGPIPNIFDNLNLKRLYLYANQLSGPIPESIGSMSNLDYINLDNNNLTGAVPDTLTQLSLLKNIWLQQNEFVSIPDFNDLTLSGTANIYLRFNQLSFSSILNNLTASQTHGFNTFDYLYQQNSEDTILIDYTDGQSVTLTAIDTSQYNSYQWKKYNGSSWTDISGETSKNLQLANLGVTDAALYKCRITNSWSSSGAVHGEVFNLVQMQNRPNISNTAPLITNSNPYDTLRPTIINHVRTFTAREAITAADTITSVAADSSRVTVSTQYLDGLGRPMQTVVRKGSPLGYDIVQPMSYDDFGRQVKEFLPFTDDSLQAGEYKRDALQRQYDFYHSHSNIAKTHYAYAEKEFEASPLNRVLKQAAPGKSWSLDSGQVVQFAYRTNSYASDGLIHEFEVRNDSLFRAGSYLDGKLNVSVTIDEAGNEVVEFTNLQGQTILKKVQGEEGYLETHYAYDDLGNLRYVLPPEASFELFEVLAADHHVGPASLDKWAFQYQYDGRRRMTAKKVPGADWVYMLYDSRDRLVLTQDGNQRLSDQWSFTKYDILNRPIVTGIYSDTSSLTYLRDTLMNVTVYHEVDTTAGSGYTLDHVFPEVAEADLLTVTYYDDYDFKTLPGFGAAYDFVPELGNDSEFTRVKGQVTGTMTRVLGSTQWLRSVNYYDDRYRVVQTFTENHSSGIDRMSNKYDFLGKVLESHLFHHYDTLDSVSVSRQFTYDHGDRLLEVDHGVSSGSRDMIWKNPIGLTISGSKLTKTAAGGWGNAGAESDFTLAAYQDGWIKVEPANATDRRMFGFTIDNTDQHYTSIDYALYLNSNGTVYAYENGTNRGQKGTYVAGDTIVLERLNGVVRYKKNNSVVYSWPTKSYDQLVPDASIDSYNGVLSNVTTSFGPRETLATNSYNEIGELVEKDLHGSLQSIDYTYNSRGWLTAINDEELAGSDNDYFGMELYYDHGFDKQAYNGNITGVRWQNALQESAQAYGYIYDPLNRLKFADYVENDSIWTNFAKQRNYQSWIKGYDLNGNILSLSRRGVVDELIDSINFVDDLSYNYVGNQLTSVADVGSADFGFKDGNTSGDDYTYDANGNMIEDANKDIDSLIYNHLNLPSYVIKDNGDSLQYVYDAAGIKLSQVVIDSTGSKTTDYIGEFIYENDTLELIQHEEGRILAWRLDSVTTHYEYQYHLKDHLGNVRVTFTSADTVDTYLATMETKDGLDDFEAIDFDNLDSRQQDNLFDHTDSGTYYNHSSYLTGDSLEIIGPAMLMPVGKQDTVTMKVYGKYKDTGTYSTTTAGAFVSELAGSLTNLSFAVETVTEAADIIDDAFLAIGTYGGTDDEMPRAYLNYIVFDDYFNYVDAGFDRISTEGSFVTSGSETGFDSLEIEVGVEQSGFIYIWLSNETAGSEVWFDDLSIEHRKSRIVQTDDYYAFGAAFNGYQRSNSKANRFKYNGMESQGDLDLGWYDYGARMYDAFIAKWTTIDPLSEEYMPYSPYGYVENNPILMLDPTGMNSENSNDCDDGNCPKHGDTNDDGQVYNADLGEWVSQLQFNNWKILLEILQEQAGTLGEEESEEDQGPRAWNSNPYNGLADGNPDDLGLSLMYDLVTLYQHVTYTGGAENQVTGTPPDLTAVKRLRLVVKSYKVGKRYKTFNKAAEELGNSFRKWFQRVAKKGKGGRSGSSGDAYLSAARDLRTLAKQNPDGWDARFIQSIRRAAKRLEHKGRELNHPGNRKR